MAKPSNPIYGYLDSCGRHSLSGWAINPESYNDEAEITVFVNGKFCCGVTADLYRQDVKAENLHATGKCGFNVRFPTSDALQYGDRVDVCVVPGDYQLENSPFVIDSQSTMYSTKLFFLHLPKTAGTAFREAIISNFSTETVYPSTADINLNGGNYPYLFKETDKGKYANIDLFVGHYPFAIRRLLADDVETITFLREPIKRAISNLLHIKTHWSDFKDKSLEEILNTPRICANQLFNLQTRYLSDTEWTWPLKYFHAGGPEGINLDNALENLEKLAFVGLTEEYDSSLRMLEMKYDFKLISSRSNVTNAKHKDIVSPEIIDTLAESNQQDIVLYERAKELFVKQKIALGLD